MLNITQNQAERIAAYWVYRQDSLLGLYGGYPGELRVVRDLLLFHIRSNGEDRDGSTLEIFTVNQLLKEAEDYFRDADFVEEDEWRRAEGDYGYDVPTLARYLMTSDGGPDTEEKKDA